MCCIYFYTKRKTDKFCKNHLGLASIVFSQCLKVIQIKLHPILKNFNEKGKKKLKHTHDTKVIVLIVPLLNFLFKKKLRKKRKKKNCD